MKGSLQRHLSLMLGSAVLFAALAAAVASFGLAYLEARELQDDMLRQIAMLSAASAVDSAAPDNPRPARGDQALGDPESRIVVVRLPGSQRPAWLAVDLAVGFHTLNAGAEHLRVFVRDGPGGNRTVVAQPTDTRDEIAINSALRTLIPLLLLLPVLAWLIVRVVRSELAPITRLSRRLDEQPADRPQPVSDEGLPTEITPFMHAINRLLERVNHLMGQQRRFIADAAHALRSPLTALSVQAQNLRGARSLEAANARVAPLQAGIERARHLTEQLLSLARAQSGTHGDAVVNVPVLARELIAEYLPLAATRAIDLGLEEVPQMRDRTSPEALRLILRNALENALKYAPEGGEVTLRLLCEGDSTVIEVVDNGPGIPVAEREHVFDAFYRMAAAGEGSGLGLAIAREAAIRMGGTVSLHDRSEGPGLVFRYRAERAA